MSVLHGMWYTKRKTASNFKEIKSNFLADIFTAAEMGEGGVPPTPEITLLQRLFSQVSDNGKKE